MAGRKPGAKKTGGRTKGKPNKKTEEQLSRAQRIIDIIEERFLDDDLDNLAPKDRVGIWAGLLEYVQPKLARTEIKGEVEVTGGVQIYLPENSRDGGENKSWKIFCGFSKRLLYLLRQKQVTWKLAKLKN